MKRNDHYGRGKRQTGTVRVELQGHDYASTVNLSHEAPPKQRARSTGEAAARRWTFRLDAPEAEQVFVAGTFNEWHPSSHALARHASGCWFGEFEVPRGQHEYRFIVDGEWRDDPNASQFVPNHCGGVNSVVTLL